MKIILGSGIVGLLAKIILGNEWKIIPFGKSRYYSFKVPLADNILIRDEKIDHFLSSELKIICSMLYPYTACYSVQGQLVKKLDPILNEAWLYKMYGEQYPTQAKPYYERRILNTVYGVRITELYKQLQSNFIHEIVAENDIGKVTKIGNGFIERGDKITQFDKLVSTIPLNSFLKLRQTPHTLQSNDTYVYHIQSEDLDLEGANQCYVIDNDIAFYKVTRISPDKRYLFYSTKDIELPGIYFKQFMNNLNILDYTKVPEAMPLGERPDLQLLEKENIFCVGSNAEWDDCRDVSSCILRLLKIAGKVV